MSGSLASTAAGDGEIVVRRGVVDDIPDVLEVWRRAGSEPSITDDADSLARLLASDPASLLLAEVDGAVGGTIVAGWDGWRGELYRLAVVPEHRRRGLARRLVAAAEQRLRSLGARRVTALVLTREQQATAFWAAVGYPHDERIARHVRTLP